MPTDGRSDPHPTDRHVGRRLRERRGVLGMSQVRLGELLGVSFQQVQKYERGANRIGSSRLLQICRALDVEPGYFFAEVAAPSAPPVPPEVRPTSYALAEDEGGFDFTGAPVADGDPLFSHRDALELARAFNRIGDPLVRRRLVELAKALGAAAYRTDAVPTPEA